MGFLLTSILPWIAAPAYAALAVVVAPSSAISQISQEEIKAVFLGKLKTLPDGTAVVPVSQDKQSAVYSEFNEKVLGESSTRLRHYWTRYVFTGKGLPPRSVAGDAQVIDFVNRTAGGIGYIDDASIGPRTKVLLHVP